MVVESPEHYPARTFTVTIHAEEEAHEDERERKEKLLELLQQEKRTLLELFAGYIYTTTSSAWRMVRESNSKEKCLGYLLLFIQYMVVMERM